MKGILKYLYAVPLQCTADLNKFELLLLATWVAVKLKYGFKFPVESEVYAWGNNAMGQCGQGHAQSPITRPKRVIGLDGVSVHQVSAGTSHSIAWTALPTDRYEMVLVML